MPEIERPDGTSIHYEVFGDGVPVLALAPGVVNSQVGAWKGDPLMPLLRQSCRVVTMDQRYAGLSTGPNYPFSYTVMTADQLAVADAAGLDRFVVVGRHIGANYALRLACLAPGRVIGAVLAGPLGRPAGAPRSAGYGLFVETCRLARAHGLEAVVAAARQQPQFDIDPRGGPYANRLAKDDEFVAETLRKGRERYVVRVVRFRDGMFPDEHPFLSVSNAEAAGCHVGLLVAPGNSALAPADLAAEIVETSGNARLAPDDPVAIMEFIEAL